MSATTEKCSDNDKTFCEYNEFRRLRYFHGMLLDDKDFRAEQQYHAGKRRFLNRMLHGSGVVCGLELKSEKGKRWIKVTSGLALDCSGNEIWVSEDKKIDLCTLLPPKKKDQGECKEDPPEDNTYYIGIRYDEKPTSPVSVYLPSGNCEEKTCENSRWKEGYCVEIVACCKDDDPPGLIQKYCKCGDTEYTGDFQDLCGHRSPPPSNQMTSPTGISKKTAASTSTEPAKPKCKCMTIEEFCEQSIPCAECCSCDKPCFVVLGKIKISEDCVVEQLCMNECRKYVLTGPMIQNLLLRVFAGAQDNFKMTVDGKKVDLPESISEYVYNPIKALCWWLPNVLEGGKFEFSCNQTAAPLSTKPPEVTTKQFEKTTAEFNRVIRDQQAKLDALTMRMNLVEKLAPTPPDPQAGTKPKTKI
jgi:hypothetical protein